MRKFALSSGAYRRYKLVQAIRHTALAGYGGIEIIADAPHGYPTLITKPERQAIQAALAERRLAVSNVNASPMTALRDEVRPSWIEADRVLRHERIQHTLDAGQLAKDLGAPTISTLAGGELEEGITREAAVKRFVAGLKQVAAVAAKGKCPQVLVDPGVGMLVASAAQVLDIVKRAKSSHIGCNINTGRLHRAGEDVAAAIREMKDSLGHVHIEDVPADGTDEVLVPGTGAVDFAAVFAALDDVGYDGWLTVDLSGADMHPDDAAKQALEFLKQFDK